MKFRNYYLKVLLVYVFVSTLLIIVLDWLWAIVIIITCYLLTYDHNFKTTKEDSIVREVKKSHIENKKPLNLQLNGPLASVSAELHIKMNSNENLVGRKKVEVGTERASLSSLIHRGSTGKMSSLRNTNQPLLSVLKNNTYLREANSYHQSPLKSPLYQSMSPAKLNSIYNSSLTPRNSFKPPLINNQFTSPSVQMHFSEHSPYINVTRHAENANDGLEIYGSYFLNKSLLNTENAENMYSLVNKNFSLPVSARKVENELYQTTCHDERQESDFAKVVDKTSTEAVITVLKANSKRKKEVNDLSQSPSMDQPSRSKRIKFDNSDLDSTLNELFPPMLSSGSPLRKRLSNIRSSSNRLVSTATQYENLHKELKLTKSLKCSDNMNISRAKLGLTEEQTDQLMEVAVQIHPVEKRNNDFPNVVDEAVKHVKEKLNRNDHAEKKVTFNDTSIINLLNESNSSCTAYTEMNKCSALKNLKSPYRRIFSSLSSPSQLGSTEKLREHPVYFTAHIDIDEIQNNREEYGSKGVSINAFRTNQEYAAKQVNVLLEEADDFSKQKNLVNLKEQFSTSVENDIIPSILSTPSLPVAATCSLVEPVNKTNDSSFTRLSPTHLKTETLKSTVSQPFTFDIQGAPLSSTSVSSSEANLKPAESKSVFSFAPTSSVMLPSNDIVAPAVQVTNNFSTGFKSQSATSFHSVNSVTSTLTTLLPAVVSTNFPQISFGPASTSFGGFSFDTKTSSNQLKTSTAVSYSIPGISFSATSATNTTLASIFSTNSCMTTSIGSNSSVQMNSLSFANGIEPKNAITATANFGLSSTLSSTSASAPFTSNLFGGFGEKSTGSLLFGNSAVCNSISATTQSSIFFGNTATSKSDEFKGAISESRSNTFDKPTSFSFVTSSAPPSVFNFTTTSSVAQSSNFFGSAPSSIFASSTTNLNTVGGLFGSTTTVPILGFPTTSSNVNQSIFGNVSSATTLFGAPVSTSAAFIASAHPNLFGSATTVALISGFNQPAQISSTGFNFGSSIATTSSGFSFVPVTQSSGFGTTNIFGNQTTVSASIFGAPPVSSSTSFGGLIGSSGPYPFGQPLSQSSTSNIFGQSTQQFSTSTMFGPPSQQTIGFNFSAKPNFGATAQPSNLFGVQPAPVKPAFNFNTQFATPSFNFSTNDTNAVGFSAAQTPSFGTLGGFASPGHSDINFNSSIPGGGFSIGAATPIPGRQTSKARRRLKK